MIVVLCLLAMSGCGRAIDTHDDDGSRHAQMKTAASVVVAIAKARKTTIDTESRTPPFTLPRSAWAPPSVTLDLLVHHERLREYAADDVPPRSSRGPPSG